MRHTSFAGCMAQPLTNRLVLWPLQNAEGAFEAILPPAELEAMYGRILASELVTTEGEFPPHGGAPPDQAAPEQGGQQKGRTQQRRASRLQGRRLAAAMGLTQLALPFRRGPHARQTLKP